jgi:hypothetical protein
MEQGDRTRLARALILASGLAVVVVLFRRAPTEHTVHVVLGDEATRVTEVRVRYALHEDGPGQGDWQREASFHYAQGHAPRVVSHEPRLASGDYDVEIDVAAETPVTVRRRITIDEHTATVDVSGAVRDSLRDTGKRP